MTVFRRAAGAVGAGVAALAVLTACSNSQVATPPRPAPSSPASPSTPPSSAPGPSAPSSTNVPPSAPDTPTIAPPLLPPGNGQSTRVPPTQWDGRAAPGPAPSVVWTTNGGRTVNVVVHPPSCGRLTANVLDQGQDTVRIALVSDVYRTLRACPVGDVGESVVTVQLAAPLGQRHLVFVGVRR